MDWYKFPMPFPALKGLPILAGFFTHIALPHIVIARVEAVDYIGTQCGSIHVLGNSGVFKSLYSGNSLKPFSITLGSIDSAANKVLIWGCL